MTHLAQANLFYILMEKFRQDIIKKMEKQPAVLVG